jgi:GTP-binding protein
MTIHRAGLPRVAIVGRPNAGKSSLFNRLARRRQAIVADLPGTTRDVTEAVARGLTREFVVLDTGGLWSGDEWEAKIRERVEDALRDVDAIIWAVDARAPFLESDQRIAGWLRRRREPVILAATKIDDPSHLGEAYALAGLGFGDPIPTSAEHALGFEELVTAVESVLPEPGEAEAEVQPIRLAIIGRPNVGKSSLLNAIVGAERVVVSETPGTTRDAVDVGFEYAGRSFVLVDTAGIRRKPSTDVERYSQMRSREAIERCDVVALIMDPYELGDNDVKLANEAFEAGRAVILVVNKWDLVPAADLAHWEHELLEKLRHLLEVPLVYTSALNEYGIHDLLAETVKAYERYTSRFPTSELNRLLEGWTTVQRPPSFKGKPLKVFYITQAGTAPPTFVLFCNNTAFVIRAYEAYLRNQIREHLGLHGVPIRILWRPRGWRAAARAEARPGRGGTGGEDSEGA